jgi:hypothetical protein
MQSYRIEAGKLVETWLILQPLGSACRHCARALDELVAHQVEMFQAK